MSAKPDWAACLTRFMVTPDSRPPGLPAAAVRLTRWWADITWPHEFDVSSVGVETNE
jgi:hypothetical protein